MKKSSDTDAHIALIKQRRKTAAVKGIVTRQRKKLVQLEKELEQARADSQSWEARFKEAEAEIEHLKSKHDNEKREYTQKIQRLANDLAVSEQSMRAIRASTSWRITRPMRLLKSFLTGRTEKTEKKSIKPLGSALQVYRKKRRPAKYIPRLQAEPLRHPSVRAIAFYLPQFHTIPENDQWWGKGFTEWSNVKPAKPLFKGHYQPHIPDALGYYDLSKPEVMAQQVELAKLYGLGGFCFYFYWFDGKTLLEMPVRNYLEDKNLDFPFCLCWANENWTRRWDGLDNEVLIGQSHSARDDVAFIKHIAQYVRDNRYIRVNGKPLILVYRPQLLPNAKATAKRWRNWCRKNGIGEIYLAYTQSFETVDPAEYGFDAAVEFPPNNMGVPPCNSPEVKASSKFKGHALDWSYLLERSRNYTAVPYALHRGACPSWDNTARRGANATVLLNANPDDFEEMVRNAAREACKTFASRSERLVFINAWNEWAEGTHLEPDKKYGYAWLQAIRQALQEVHGAPSKRIVVVSHDAHPHGAQYLSLNIIKMLKERFGYTVDIVLLGDGPLLPEFQKLARVYNLNGQDPRAGMAKELARALYEAGSDIAICNTTVSGLFAQTLSEAGIKVVSLIHELPSVIEQYGLHEHIKSIAGNAQKIVFPAKLVADAFERFAPLQPGQKVLRPQGVYKRNRFRTAAEIKAAASALRKQFNLSKTSKIVLGVGYADKRKGFDLFVQTASEISSKNEDIIFIWAGHQEVHLSEELSSVTESLCKRGALILPGLVEDTDPYYAGADIYMLTSREDPYPSTVLEALDVGLPVAGFEGVTGTTDLIEQMGGRLVPAFDVSAMKRAVMALAGTKGKATRWSRMEAFRQRHDVSFQGYIHDLLGYMGCAPYRVSVVVPNYNYAQYLPGRIESIAKQTYPISELIILDDASSDNSLDVIKILADKLDIPVRIIANKKNRGSVFRQWLKGTEAATGDFVWIAEADDLSEPDFLATVMKGFQDDDVVLSYCQSKQISSKGKLLGSDYLYYVKDISPTQWQQSYKRGGEDEITNGLSVKNTIPNVSAVVFRREALLDVMKTHIDEIARYRVAGDWYIYVNLLRLGSVAFHAKSLNLHRRHNESVTISRFGSEELEEIKSMQEYVSKYYYIDKEYRDKASAYLEQLKKQFTL